MLNPNASKSVLRTMISEDTREFLARGGRIILVKAGESGAADAARVREQVFTAEYMLAKAEGCAHDDAVNRARRACGQDASMDDEGWHDVNESADPREAPESGEYVE